MKDKIFKYIYPFIFKDYFINEIYWHFICHRNIHNYYDISYYYYNILDLLSGNIKYILNDTSILADLFYCIIHCDILELFQYIHNSQNYNDVLLIYYKKWFTNYNDIIIEYELNGYFGDNIRNYLLLTNCIR